MSASACESPSPTTSKKAPLKLVPLITEPFRRLVVDTVGPLPVTQSGYRYILTMLCPATKSPEVVPFKRAYFSRDNGRYTVRVCSDRLSCRVPK